MIVEKGDNMSENSEYQIFPLNKLVPGETAIIVKIDSEIKEHKNHLINLGFMPGEKITPVLSPRWEIRLHISLAEVFALLFVRGRQKKYL